MAKTSFDTYTWGARVAPVLIVLLPVGLGIAIWFPDVPLANRLGAVLIAPTVLGLLLAQIGRDPGYKKQARLWESWGGAPTTQRLRHRNPHVNTVIRTACHHTLAGLYPTLTIPAPEEEAANPTVADETYEAYVKKLISATRDRDRFPLLFKENVNYGFRRNLWGMKPVGLLLALGGLASCVTWLTIHSDSITAESLVATATALGLLTACLFCITPSWVRIPAEAYADRLFECCEPLKAEGS